MGVTFKQTNAGIATHYTIAVELDTEAARLYQERFPNDIVIVADAHQYLLEHFKEFDFISLCASSNSIFHLKAGSSFMLVITLYPPKVDCMFS